MYHKDAFSQMKDALDNYPTVGLVYAGMNFIDEQDEIIQTAPSESPITNYVRNVVRACFMYRSEVVDKIGE